MPKLDSDKCTIDYLIAVAGRRAIDFVALLGNLFELPTEQVRAAPVIPLSLGEIRGWNATFNFSAREGDLAEADGTLFVLGPDPSDDVTFQPGACTIAFVDVRRPASSVPTGLTSASEGDLSTGAGVLDAAKAAARAVLVRTRSEQAGATPAREAHEQQSTEAPWSDVFKTDGPHDAFHIETFSGPHSILDATGALLVRVATTGLHKLGYPELELVDVPTELDAEANILLNAIATSIHERGLPSDGGWSAVLPCGALMACFLTRTQSFGREVMRAVDFTVREPLGAAKHALAALAAHRALGLAENGRTEEAVQTLTTSVAWFPGEPNASLSFRAGRNANENNNLAYYVLAKLGVEPDKNYAEALVRSTVLLRFAAGGILPTEVSEAVLAQDALAIVQATHTIAGALPPAPDGATFLLSPLIRKEGRELRQHIAIGSPSFRGYFVENPVRTKLCTREVADLASRIYTRWRDNPGGALSLGRETMHDIYEESYGLSDEDRPSRLLTFETASSTTDHLPFLSRILACLGRELAAGLSTAAIGTRWGLTSDSSLLAVAEFKLETLRRREAAEIRRVYTR